MKKFLLVIAILFPLLQDSGISQVTKTGTTAAKFLNVKIRPHTNTMDKTFTTINNNTSTLY